MPAGWNPCQIVTDDPEKAEKLGWACIECVHMQGGDAGKVGCALGSLRYVAEDYPDDADIKAVSKLYTTRMREIDKKAESDIALGQGGFRGAEPPASDVLRIERRQQEYELNKFLDTKNERLRRQACMLI